MHNYACVCLVTENKKSKINSNRNVLVACENVCVVLRRGQRVTVFGNRLLERGEGSV